MTTLRVVVSCFLAHLIGFGLVIWLTIEMQAENVSTTKEGLRLLVGYDAVVTLLLGLVLVFACIQAYRKHNEVFIVDPSSSEGAPNGSVDLEVK